MKAASSEHATVRPKARRDRPDAAPHLKDAPRHRGLEQRRKKIEGDRDLVDARLELLEVVGRIGGKTRQLLRRSPL